MNILSMRKDPDGPVVKHFNAEGFISFSVILTVRSWFKKKEVKAYPTRNCRLGGDDSLLFVYYALENGEELRDEDSRQIYNWVAWHQEKSK